MHEQNKLGHRYPQLFSQNVEKIRCVLTSCLIHACCVLDAFLMRAWCMLDACLMCTCLHLIFAWFLNFLQNSALPEGHLYMPTMLTPKYGRAQLLLRPINMSEILVYLAFFSTTIDKIWNLRLLDFQRSTPPNWNLWLFWFFDNPRTLPLFWPDPKFPHF